MKKKIFYLNLTNSMEMKTQAKLLALTIFHFTDEETGT
jgi:hypothetical protein